MGHMHPLTEFFDELVERKLQFDDASRQRHGAHPLHLDVCGLATAVLAVSHPAYGAIDRGRAEAGRDVHRFTN